jgi:hypothetical protein
LKSTLPPLLITKKYGDYKLLKQVLNIVLDKEHLAREGLRKIVVIKAPMNKGLSEKLKISFADVKSIEN